MSERRILIVGASGFLGSNLALAARSDRATVAHSSRVAVRGDKLTGVVGDLTAPGAAARLVREADAGLVINCAALADVDLCERDPILAQRLNAEVPGELAEACRSQGSVLVHISSDAVFGLGPGPFTPETTPAPVNAYGSTKVAGERRVLEALPDALVLRTNVVGWSPTGRRSLFEFFHARLALGEPVKGFVDVLFRPVVASDLWPLVSGLVSNRVTGIWHATGANLISKYDFAMRVARTFGFNAGLVEPSSIRDAGLGAPRPAELDVVPSNGRSGLGNLSIDEGLERLRELEARGYRGLLASIVARG